MTVFKFIGDMLIIPSEIELALRTHENVADANVFSITNSSGLDMCGCAWIILKDKRKNTSIEELKAIVGRKSIDYIKIVDDFPINENGKVVKTEMSRRFKIELNL
jgi:acyl-coenzyme A synthetase/AMP-(fatty) acid ligase